MNYKKHVLVFVLFSLCFPARAQYLDSESLAKEQMRVDMQDYDKIENVSIEKTNDGDVYLSWVVRGDTVDGCFIVYKSRDYIDPELVSIINYPNNKHPNTYLSLSVVDSTKDEFYNMYHIIKADKRRSLMATPKKYITQSAMDVRVDGVVSDGQSARTSRNNGFYAEGF